MSDIGEFWRDVKPELEKEGRERKDRNLLNAREKLTALKIPFRELTEHHFRVLHFNYWPSTGLFIDMKTSKRGRGINNLLKAVRIYESNS